MTARQHEVLAVFGSRLQRERERRGWTLRECGDKCGISAATVLRAEAGHDIRLSGAIQLVAVLGMSFDALLAACGACDGSPPDGFICSECRREGSSQ